MNNFVTFLCAAMLVSQISARPDLSLGYRYNQGHSSGGGSFLHAPVGIATSYSPTASGNSYFANQPSVGQISNSGFVPSTQLGFGSSNQGSFGSSNQVYTGGVGQSTLNTGFGGGNSQYSSGSYSQQTQQSVQQGFPAPIINKHFYLHAAPSDDDEQEIVRHIQIGQPQKNYRVVFIDTPSSHSAKAKIIADLAPTEEKTAIYVLSKKTNALDVETEVVTPAPINNKPEVFFVKYKTPEEAIHAQHTIQAQYDSLGGTSDVSHEGPIPVSSVIGTLDGASGGNDFATSASSSVGSIGSESNNAVEITHTGINTQQTYLPPNRS